MSDNQNLDVLEPSTEPVKKSGIAHRLYTGEISYDFVGKRNRWYLISGIVHPDLARSARLPGHQLGHRVHRRRRVPGPGEGDGDDDRRRPRRRSPSLDVAGDDLTVTTIGDNTVRVQTKTITTRHGGDRGEGGDRHRRRGRARAVAYSLIGASWGQQISTQALIALAVFLALVMLFIWVYFREFKMSIAAIVALLHDLVITIGIYALVGFSVTPATMIGVLTILGYSLYDTVVVFDKIRENTQRHHQQPAHLLRGGQQRRQPDACPVAEHHDHRRAAGRCAAVHRLVHPRHRTAEGPGPRPVRRHDRRRLLLDLHRQPAAGTDA